MARTIHFFATYYNQEKQAPTLIQSLLMQTMPNWKLTICSNADNTVLNVKDKYGYDPRINFILTNDNTGYWGALNRRDFIQSDQLLPDEMLINTSVEDYYVPKTVEYISYKPAHRRMDGTEVWIDRDEDFVMFDFTHHHFAYELKSCISQPRKTKIDWGNYALRGAIAKQVKMEPIVDTNGNVIVADPWKEFMGDGYFVENIFKQFPNISNVRLPKVLFAKN